MTVTAISPNFIVRVPKEEEKKRREMDGNLYLHPNFVWLTRNTQYGFIESISEEAKKQMPDAIIGDMLLMHHFVQRSNETKGDNDKFLAMEDLENKYYKVGSKEIPGQNNMSYGIYRDGIIIPHPQYVFLEKEIDNKDGWYQSNDEVYAKLADIKSKIEYLSKTRMTSDIAMEIKKREAEMMKINLSLQTKEYLPYKIAFANKSLGIENGTTIFVLNIATQTCIEVMGREYRIAETKYIGAV